MTTTHRISTAIVLTCALGIAATSASARPFDLNANGSYVPSANGSAAGTHDPGTRSVAAAGAGYGSGDSAIPSTGAHHPQPEAVASGGAGAPNTSATVVRVLAPTDGFDWGDAGIGAAGGLALATIGVGGALAVSHHRTRRATAPQP
jgi:hypothetical protein